MKLSDFHLTAADFARYGRGLERPECVWADHDGIWTSDLRGGIARVAKDESPDIIGTGIVEPNGFSRRTDGSFVVAGIGDGKLHLVSPRGDVSTLLESFDGKPLGTVNYACADGPERIWLSVMTRAPHWYDALTTHKKDGYILRIEQGHAEIVADGLDLTNEVKVSPDGRYLYAVETLGRRLVRFRIRSDASLGKKEIVGPDILGRGAVPDGFAFDSYGNIWVTIISENALYAIDKNGDVHAVYRDSNGEAVEAMARGIEQRNGTVDDLVACANVEGPLRLPTSLAFGGKDGRTVFVGTLALDHLVTFRLPERLN